MPDIASMPQLRRSKLCLQGGAVHEAASLGVEREADEPDRAGFCRVSAAESMTDRYGRMREVAAFIAENYATKLQLADLAAMAGMSESRFKHVFAKTFAATPGRYITTIRLNAARRLLEETDDLLSDIATATGFFDQSHMTRAFKAMRGVTPGEYCRRHRSQAK